MLRHRAALLASLIATSSLLLTACSVDSLIWGPDGARVIEVTEDVISDVQAGNGAPLACEGSEVETGDPRRWSGLSAGEPERLDGDFWEEQQALGATWTINLEGLDTDTAENGGSYPSYVFYSDRDDALCVLQVEWGTVTF